MDDQALDANTDRPPHERPAAEPARNIRMMRLLERIAARFNQASVPLMVLKGAALHLTLYEEPDDRAMADLDLMIHPKDFDQAFHLLEQLDGLRGEALVRDDFFPRFHYELEYTLGKIYPIKIDLHVRPFRPLRYSQLVPVDALWVRAETVSIGRTNIFVPSADDMLLHLAVHAAVHGYTQRKWLVDIKQWIERHGGDIDWDRFLTTVKQWRMALPVRKAFQRVRRDCDRACPPRVIRRLSKMQVNWRDRLALWQAPRDAVHSLTHVAVNAVCTPGLGFVLAYLWAVLVPDRAHMADWYQRRHWGWLPCAHLLRLLGPVSKKAPRLWAWCTKIETQKSSTHGIGVFAIRDIKHGEVVARYHGRPVQRCGTYVVPVKTESGEKKRYELTGKLKFLNHACHPNAELSGFQLVALKPIRAGQEIKIDYGESTCDCKPEQREESVSSRDRATDERRRTRSRKRPSRHRAGRSRTERIGTARGAQPALATRRTFLRGAAKKALYVTPVVMTLAAQQARAGSAGDFDSTCGETGSPCAEDADCCEHLAEPLACEMMTCCVDDGNPCNVDSDCCQGSMGATCVASDCVQQ